jgi:hypothetical protein
MRARAVLWLPVLAAALGGCASVGELFLPAPAGPQRSATVDEEPVAAARPAPAAREPAPGPAKPAPAAPAPPQAPPAPAAPLPPPPRTAAIPREPSLPAPVQAERRIEGTEKLVQKIDPSRLVREQRENYLTIQSFLAKAREALSTRDVQRAFTLADKAYLLADELSKGPR